MAVMENYFGLVEQKDLLDFSQNLSVTRNYLGNTLFPDQKTQYAQAEYYRLCDNGTLPQVAKIHALDTEAVIGQRIPLDKVEVEELLIKEKINQTEQLRRMTRGMRMDNVETYVFDDAARLAESVIARTELAKMEVLSTGKMTIAENGVSMVIDYQMPDENMVTTLWDADANILSDILTWKAVLTAKGFKPNRAITTEAVVYKIKTNTAIQEAIKGTSGAGILPTLDEINALFASHAGITIVTNDDFYAIPTVGADGAVTLGQGRFFPEDTFVMCSVGENGAIGYGIWGVTPEEELQGGAFDSKRQQQYVTITQWTTPDPTCVWTKASGLFIPALPGINGVLTANVNTAAQG